MTAAPARKIVLLGASGTGKTTFALRFAHGDAEFDAPASTVGADFVSGTVELDDGSVVKAHLWDTAGQERFRSVVPMFVNNAAAAIVVVDSTRADTLSSAAEFAALFWQRNGRARPCVVVANKCDLTKRCCYAERRAGMSDEMRRCGFSAFYETSARTGMNVAETMRAVAHLIAQSERGEMPAQKGGGSVRVTRERAQQRERKCRC